MFTVQYTSVSAARRHHARRSLPSAQAPSARTDIQMQFQENMFHMEKETAHRIWIEEHAPKQRTLELEKMALNMLVVESIRRQRENNSQTLATHISQFINPTKKPIGSEEKKVGSPRQSPDPAAHEEEEEEEGQVIYDLSFIEKKLLEDVAILLEAHGYDATLKAFHSFNPWKL